MNDLLVADGWQAGLADFDVRSGTCVLVLSHESNQLGNPGHREDAPAPAPPRGKSKGAGSNGTAAGVV